MIPVFFLPMLLSFLSCPSGLALKCLVLFLSSSSLYLLSSSCGVSDSFCGPVSVAQHLPHQAPFPNEPSTVAGLFRGRVLKAFCSTLGSRSVGFLFFVCLFGFFFFAPLWNSASLLIMYLVRGVWKCLVQFFKSLSGRAFLSSWRILNTTGPSTTVSRRTPSGLWVCFWSQSRRQQYPQLWWWESPSCNWTWKTCKKGSSVIANEKHKSKH